MPLRTVARGLPAALLAAVVVFSSAAETPAQILAQANAALQAGEADKALALLKSLPSSDANQAEAANLECRVRLTLEQWDAAANNCQLSVRLDALNSNYHLWLGRSLGERAARASFLNAFSLAKRTRAEFEEAARLNPRNADAMADLGTFYEQAPSAVGGGIEKAEAIAAQLDNVDPARAHELRGQIAEQRKDFDTAEREFKQATAAGEHPAPHWIALAGFYRRRKRWTEMESAVHNGVADAKRDKRDSAALFDGASILSETDRDPALAVKIFEDYLANPAKTEEAPAFVAHTRLAQLESRLGDRAAADRERAAALALASEYKPAQDSNSPQTRPR